MSVSTASRAAMWGRGDVDHGIDEHGSDVASFGENPVGHR
jgi:hypothetical protein